MSAGILLAILTTVVAVGCGGNVDDGASNTRSTAAGGYTTAAGASPAGGTSATGGITAAGGTTITGGAAADCSGSLESIQDVNGHQVRVAKPITVAAPSGSSTYQIDATEVTRGQYADWVATNPPLPSSGDATCGWKSAGSFAQDSSCMTSASVCQGADCDNHPVVCVDWCAARYYCAAVGKRLCGAIGGGAYRPPRYEDANTSQREYACSSGGANTYPYGNTYQAEYCNGYDYWKSVNGTTMPVGTLSKCQTSGSGCNGIYDLSGSVTEWEDSCYDIFISVLTSSELVKGTPACLLRGGAFDSYGISGSSGIFSVAMKCSDSASRGLDEAKHDIGFRCCSP